MHHRLVRLVLEVAIPAASELWRRPLIHLCQFLFSGTNFHTSINTVGSKRTRALDIPFVKNGFLNFWYTTDEVVKTLGAYLTLAFDGSYSSKGCTGLSSVNTEGQVVVLEIEANTRKVNNGLDTNSLELSGITDTAALKDQWG